MGLQDCRMINVGVLEESILLRGVSPKLRRQCISGGGNPSQLSLDVPIARAGDASGWELFRRHLISQGSCRSAGFPVIQRRGFPARKRSMGSIATLAAQGRY